MAEPHSNRPDHWLKQYQLVFWDFDGVIKESVDVKTGAFRDLFALYGEQVVQQVVAHHLAHGGLSRHAKIEHALRYFVGIEPGRAMIRDMADQFGDLVREKVVQAAWVPGVEALLRGNPYGQIFILVTGTPEEEIDWILGRLDLRGVFHAVFGTPMRKTEAVRETLLRHQIEPEKCIFLGDSRADLEAARAFGVTFVLRETDHGGGLFAGYSGPRIRDLNRA